MNTARLLAHTSHAVRQSRLCSVLHCTHTPKSVRKLYPPAGAQLSHVDTLVAKNSATAALMAQQQESITNQQPVKMVLVVAVALIDSQHRLLLAQRPPGKAMAGLWEFPGGKVDPGETPEAALVRELQEELNIQVDARDLQPLTFASHTYDTFHLLMPLYVCREWSGEVHGLEGQQLAWVTPRQLHDYPMPAADVPLVQPVLQAMEAGRTAV